MDTGVAVGEVHLEIHRSSESVTAAPSARAGWVRIADWLMAATVVMYVAAAVYHVSVPGDRLVGAPVVDDAFYYLRPAQHLLEGRGYSFDGVARTNGVQPLWAGACVVLAALIEDPGTLVRAMAFVSAMLWMFGGVVLYRAFRNRWTAIGLVAGVGWTLTGVSGLIALQGMENGLHGLLAAMLVAAAMSFADAEAPAGARRWLWLGTLLALFALTRVDSALLALIVGALCLFGMVRLGGRARAGFQWREALLLAAPGIVLFGGWLAFSQVYFGSAMPLSGRVKLMYAVRGPSPHESLGKSYEWHTRHVLDLASAPVTHNFDLTWWKAFQTVSPKKWMHRGYLYAAAAGVGGIACLLLVQIVRRRSWAWLCLGLAAFVAVRLLIYAAQLPTFTPYCIWYFSPEIMLIWVAIGVSAWLCGRVVDLPAGMAAGRQVEVLAATLSIAVAAAMVAIAGPTIFDRPPVIGGENPFARAGKWIRSNIPAGTRIGAFSSGIVSYYAPSHEVVNLDGLMNDLRYYREFLQPRRPAEYVAERGIAYLADYANVDTLKDGQYFDVPVRDFEFIRWWPMSAEEYYVVWRTPYGRETDRVPVDRNSALQFAAVVHNHYEIADDERVKGLAAEAAALQPSRIVATSFAPPTERGLRHVLVTPEQMEAILSGPVQPHVASRSGVRFGDAVELVGFELSRDYVQRGGSFLLTRHWRRLDAGANLDQVSIEAWIYPCEPRDLEQIPVAERVLHQTRGCHGTFVAASWPEGATVSETYEIPIPRETPAGVYAIRLGVYHPQRGWLRARNIAGADEGDQTFLCQLRVE